ncbi:uncharacterized protein LOC116805104 [Drosophila grimshawi]|uniref:uncharacterized protein LOC116805104 n=1 Tax=Drosophila grimshawi TaxID=7222 RepID=UPI000C86FC94|nr:uncharacterized protein LOC116805104 [Drosophila grimshawi]
MQVQATTRADSVQMSKRNSNNNTIYDELDKENQNQCCQPGVVPASNSTSKCRRDLRAAFTKQFNSISVYCPSPSPRPEILSSPPVSDVADLAQCLPGGGHFYSSAAGSLGRCCQPQICSVLLHALHSPHHNMLNYGDAGITRSNTATSSIVSTTNDSSSPRRRPLHLANGQSMNPIPTRTPTSTSSLLLPYRTLSHFGFNSPRLPVPTEHKHLPGGAECIRYRPSVQRALSYEEIFATPRYEHLCHYCFEQLLRLKPELRRRSAEDEPEDLISCSSSVPSLKLNGKEEEEAEKEEEEEEAEKEDERTLTNSVLCNVSTQTTRSLPVANFLNQIEGLNYAEESTNGNYVPGHQAVTSYFSLSDFETPTSPGASATSAQPMKTPQLPRPDSDRYRTDITEVWNFGNWQEQAQQQPNPLVERCITLEITQLQFAEQSVEPDANNSLQLQEQRQGEMNMAVEEERQLMSRDERQRRKLEFEELWQDHVHYFGAKEQMEQEAPATVKHTVTMSLDAQEAHALRIYDCRRQPEQEEDAQMQQAVDDKMVQAFAELQKMLKKFELSLSVVGETLEQLVATTKILQTAENKKSVEESFALDASVEENGSLFRAIDLENIPDADDAASVSEPQRFNLSEFSNDEEENGEPQAEIDHEEKRDDEKPVTPLPNANKLKDAVEASPSDEKDIDEHEMNVDEDAREGLEETQTAECSSHFSPLEREILESIEADKLKERESIFGKIDQSIRNKLPPSALQSIVCDVEETFVTCTHIVKTPGSVRIPHLFQFGSDPHPSARSRMDTDATSIPSSAHTRLITRHKSRMSRSLDSSPDDSQLESAISSSTFVVSGGCPRKKRNFIKENIRNASKPRSSISKSTFSSRKKRSVQIQMQMETDNNNATSDDSSVCTFHAEQRSSSARLWVSMPTTPRSFAGQNRGSAISPSRSPQTPCSSFAKRFKPMGGMVHPPKLRRGLRSALNRTTSSSTFFTDVAASPQLMQRTYSSNTFNLNFLPEEQLKESQGAQSMDVSDSEQSMEQQMDLYMSDDENEANEAADHQLLQAEAYSGNTYEPNRTETTGDMETNSNDMLDAKRSQNGISSADDEQVVNGNKAGAETPNGQSAASVESSEQMDTQEVNESDLKMPTEEFEYDEEELGEEEEAVASLLDVHSSAYPLSSVRGTFNLDTQKNKWAYQLYYDSADSSSDGDGSPKICRKYPKTKGIIEVNNEDANEVADADEEDDKPSTSMAAAKIQKRRKNDDKEDAKDSYDKDSETIELTTLCTLTSGTLHITDESLDKEIPVPRCEISTRHCPIIDDDDWTIPDGEIEMEMVPFNVDDFITPEMVEMFAEAMQEEDEWLRNYDETAPPNLIYESEFDGTQPFIVEIFNEVNQAWAISNQQVEIEGDATDMRPSAVALAPQDGDEQQSST